MRRLHAIIILVVAAFAFSACASATDSESADTSASEQQAPAAADTSADDEGSAAPAEVKAAEELDFTSTTTAGDEFTGASLAGKPAVLWFWAPWCHICQNEAPTVRAAAESSDVEFLGVAALDSAPSMQGFVKKYDLDFTNLADTDAAVWAKFGVTSQPAFAFISADGDVEVVAGSLSKSKLQDKIAELEKS